VASRVSSRRRSFKRGIKWTSSYKGETNVREQTLSESFALELMREGKLLLRMHTVNGMRWFIVPGGQVAESVVKRLLARPDVQPYDSGLFPGCAQTFRLHGRGHAIQT